VRTPNPRIQKNRELDWEIIINPAPVRTPTTKVLKLPEKTRKREKSKDKSDGYNQSCKTTRAVGVDSHVAGKIRLAQSFFKLMDSILFF
jgi:hypothetical protein